ncbi:MAG TPA: penicillin acylase family protein [Chitinophagaceae bacterium]|nr:penicillin acylase family protein [Chitinophagaceae bacterium]
MKIIPFLIFGLVTIALIVILNSSLLLPAPLGKLLAPQSGVWQNAEPVNADFSDELSFPQLQGNVNVYFDDRLVPHVFADKENDAFFVQGYLHAKFRLWQMEFQTHAAAGRISELIGKKGLEFDRDKRRLGMVFAAENSLKEVEKDSATKAECDNYTAGANAYIESLTESNLPLEYKLLGYAPEKWTNLKTALFLKYMSLDLAGGENDFEYTNAKSVFSSADFDKIYPIIMDSLDPIVPKGTLYPAPGIELKIPSTADSLYFNKKDTATIEEQKPDPNNGSNNWAVSGIKTKSGFPILCNDPHLGLNLPSLWYEMQISTPAFNAYGVSFPGAPAIIIGFNDSCAFGFTNAERDVRDYYEIKFRDDSRKEYWFNNEWHKTTFRTEHIKIKGSPVFIDSVAYTNIGPVMYDKNFNGGKSTNNKFYAVRWKAHDPSNELKMFTLLDRAKNYADYSEAIKYLHTPGQNCLFASKNGDIAIWDQGEFPAKWKRQGDFVMPGIDSSYFWQGMIPQEENPHQVNPERGFVSSANQLPADSAYPYYLGGSYPPYRGWEINKRLTAMDNITPEDMMKLQTDNYNVFAEMAVPVLIKNMDVAKLDGNERNYFELLKKWDLKNGIQSKGATIFVLTWDSLENKVWKDEFMKSGNSLMLPHESTLLNNILKDSAFKFIDDVNTPQVETLGDVVTSAFKSTIATLKDADINGKLEWAKYKDTKVENLARLDAFSRLHLPIGGGTNTINATNTKHGPSWRMVVSLTPETQSWGVYPGGQSGNPGSRFYDSFIDTWVKGAYNILWIMKGSDTNDKRVKWKMQFSPEG